MITRTKYFLAWNQLRDELAAAGDDKEKIWQAMQKYEAEVVHNIGFTLGQLETIMAH